MRYDLLIHSGTYFDGTGAVPQDVDVAVLDGKVARVGKDLPRDCARSRIDASGHWVIPGMIDNHTHYDAELLLDPGLGESVRHGVTTVCIGSCSLSMIYSNANECADIFSRVEAVPRQFVLQALKDKSWSSAQEYAAHLDTLALGPNIMAYIGHSDLRTSVMGLDRATLSSEKPSKDQLATMISSLEDALDAGFLGLSCMTNPWDKIGGDSAMRSRALPSTFASWRELRAFHRVLREREANLQSAPNITTKYNGLIYAWESCSFHLRKPLRTSLITIADTKANPLLSGALLGLSRFVNAVLGGGLRWQSLPQPFELYADGIDLVVFEEFGAGEEVLHLADYAARNELFADQEYRRRFRKDYDRRFTPRVWHRDLFDAYIVDAPDKSLKGKSFGELAKAQSIHPVDAYLDLVSQYGEQLRWKTTLANHRPKQLASIITHPDVQLGFSDAGAHLRNMGFYNFPLHALRWSTKNNSLGEPIYSPERAVQRVTQEPAQWLGVDAGTLHEGDRADIAIINPATLNEDLDAYHEAPVEVFGGLKRQVRRNDDAVLATLIGGQIAYYQGAFAPGFGHCPFGRFLKRGERMPARQKTEPAAPNCYA